MLGSIEYILRRQKLIDGKGTISCNISIGRSLSVQVFIGNRRHLNLKISNGASLREEFKILNEVHSIIPKIVPMPLALEQIGHYNVIISEGVKHRSLNKFDLVLRQKNIINVFNTFTDLGVKNFTLDNPVQDHLSIIRESAHKLNQLNIHGPLNKWLESTDFSEIQLLPHIMQHGDFLQNNIGMHKGDIYIFDWEDFGQVKLPGYDLFLFLFSFYDFKFDTVNSSLFPKENSFSKKIMSHYFQNTGMDINLFKKLYLAYIVLFLCSKKDLGYKIHVQNRWGSILSLALRENGFF
jgi:hypothetical protein